MKDLNWPLLVVAIFALLASDATWARGGHDGGGSHIGGSSHRHFGGGGSSHRHFSGGGISHRHFSGGHRHIGGGHHHNYNRFNFGINLGGYYPGYYGYRSYGYRRPYYRSYAYPSTIVVPSSPPVYIQRATPAPAQPQTNYWYYCREPDGYYPYVKQCPAGWLQVAPQPAQ